MSRRRSKLINFYIFANQLHELQMKFTWVYSFLFLLFGLLSCEQSQIKTGSNPDTKNLDSVKIYYDLSHDKSLPMLERMKLIDRSYQYSRKKSPDSVSFVSLNYKAHLYSKNSELDSAIFYTDEIIETSQKVGDSAALAKAYGKLGRYNRIKNKPDSAYLYYSESKNMYEALKDSAAVGKCLMNMAIILSNSGMRGQSDQDALEALSFLKNTSDGISIGSVYNCMAINSKSQRDFEEALYWYDLAIKSTSKKENAETYRSNSANIYRELGRYDKAISIIEESLENAKIAYEKDPSRLKEQNLIRLSDNLSYTLWKKTKDPSLESHFLKNLEKRKTINNLSGEIISHQRLVEFYEDTNISKSAFHAKEAYQIALDLNHSEEQMKTLAVLIRFSENDNASFKTYSKNYIQLKDSISATRNYLSSYTAKIRYDSERTRSENENLKVEKIERQIAFEKSKTMNLVYLFLGFISILIFVFIQKFLQSKYKKDKLQEVLNTETRISKKVHDEVANDLYKVMTRIEGTSNEKVDIVDDLELIYEKTRDISRNTNALDLEQDFNEILKDLFLGYKTAELNIITKGLNDIQLNNLEIYKKVAIYRVMQELMTNMKKHSEASLVILTFKDIKDKIQITYSDDGIGSDSKKSNGLINVENRIVDLKGRFTFNSEKNKGFKAKILI